MPNCLSFTDIDDCVNHTCANGGSCVDGVNSYSCNCSVGYTGDHCQTGNILSANRPVKSSIIHPISCHINYLIFTDIDDCVNHTCANGGSCVDGINSYSCNCTAGYTGDRCQTGNPFSFPNNFLSISQSRC